MLVEFEEPTQSRPRVEFGALMEVSSNDLKQGDSISFVPLVGDALMDSCDLLEAERVLNVICIRYRLL